MNNTYIDGFAEALEYMVECTLATVEYMATLKIPNKSELSRQISIAQTGINSLINNGKTADDTLGRVRQVMTLFDGDVRQWMEHVR